MLRIQVATKLLFQSYFHCLKYLIEVIISILVSITGSVIKLSFSNKNTALSPYFTSRMVVSVNNQVIFSFISAEDKQIGRVAANKVHKTQSYTRKTGSKFHLCCFPGPPRDIMLPCDHIQELL